MHSGSEKSPSELLSYPQSSKVDTISGGSASPPSQTEEQVSIFALFAESEHIFLKDRVKGTTLSESPILDFNVTLLKPSKRFVSYNPFVRLACVASVSNRVIAGKVGAGANKKKWKGEGEGEGRRQAFPSLPSPTPVISFFCLLSCQLSRRTRAETLAAKVIVRPVDNQSKLAWAMGSTSLSNKRSLNLTRLGG